MKLSVSFSGLDAASRRLALQTARRAEALVHPASHRIVVSEDRAPSDLGADAWPGAMPPETPGAAAAHGVRGTRL
jgi:hypothetical protein